MSVMPRWQKPFLLLAAIAAGACGGDTTGPDPAMLLGTWEVTNYVEAGVIIPIEGTWEFFEDGTLDLTAAIAPPDGSPAEFRRTGTWEIVGGILSMVLDGVPNNWSLAFGDDTVTLTLLPPASASRFVLVRPGSQ